MKSMLSLFCLLLLATSGVAADRFQVLVVMSYEENNPWSIEIKEGIESVLAAGSDLHFVYMDTKVNFDGGPQKAAVAYEAYQKLSPDGVITVDDNAQWMFVEPYLKNKVDMPIMFCGVNAKAEKYGFPNQHISGTLERGHIRESIAFMKQLRTDFERACFLTRESPSGLSLKQQVEEDQQQFIVENGGFYMVNSTNDLSRLSSTLTQNCDAIYIDSLEGIVDDGGKALNHRQVFQALEQIYPGPFIGANRYHVEQGALSAVVKTGQEQGRTAAKMLLKAMRGTP